MRQIFWHVTQDIPKGEFLDECIQVGTFDGISPIKGETQTTTIYYRNGMFYRITTDAFNTNWWIGNIT